MPLIIDHLKDSGLTCPRFSCDVCGKLIESAGDGIVAWNSELGERVEPSVLHKDCDLRLRPQKMQWMDLSHALVYLLHNLKMDQPKQLAEARREVALLNKHLG